MKENKLPFSLISLKMSTYDSEHLLAKSYPGETLFDDRSDFAIDFKQSSLAVLLSFANERALLSDNVPGIRRPVSVSLIDATDSCVLSMTTITVSIPRGESYGIYRVDFPFAYADIDCDHTYKVCVRDDRSGRMLDLRSLNVFDEYRFGKPISDCFSAQLGGIGKISECAYYKSFQARCPGYYSVRFKLKASFEVTPWQMPEMEVRLHFPYSGVVSRFGKLECGGYDSDEYTIEVPFLFQSSDLGIGYAELICMNFPIAGFVFNSDADDDPIMGGGA